MHYPRPHAVPDLQRMAIRMWMRSVPAAVRRGRATKKAHRWGTAPVVRSSQDFDTCLLEISADSLLSFAAHLPHDRPGHRDIRKIGPSKWGVAKVMQAPAQSTICSTQMRCADQGRSLVLSRPPNLLPTPALHRGAFRRGSGIMSDCSEAPWDCKSDQSAFANLVMSGRDPVLVEPAWSVSPHSSCKTTSVRSFGPMSIRASMARTIFDPP